MSALVPDFWGKSDDPQRVVTLLHVAPLVDDETDKIGFTADVAMRLSAIERLDEVSKSTVETEPESGPDLAASA